MKNHVHPAIFTIILLSISILSGIAAAGPNDSRALVLAENWSFQPFKRMTGSLSMEVDISSQPYPEIICNYGESRIAIITNDFGPNGYSIKWQSDMLGDNSFNTTVMVDHETLKRFGRDQIIAVQEQGIYLFDRPSRTLMDQIEWTDFIEAACVGDYNGDGNPELFLATRYDGIQIANIDTFEAVHSYSYDAQDLVVGQFDDDAAMELAITADYSSGGYIIDLTTDAVEWVYYPDFGRYMKAGDIDGDGRDELVSAGDWSDLRVFDIELQTVKWELETNYDNGRIEIVDLEDDGQLELLMSDGQWGSIHCFNSTTGEELWTMSNEGYGPSDLTAADVDQDGVKEILWGNISSSWDGKELFIGNYKTGDLEWYNLSPYPPWKGFDAADIDLDGVKEIVFGSLESDNGYHGSLIFIYNARTHRREAVHSVDDISPLKDLYLENIVPSSSIPELIVITDTLSVRNPVSFEEIWSTDEEINCSVCSDIDGDGSIELIASGGMPYSDDHIIVYNGRNGQIEWESMSYSGSAEHIEIADIDNDGAQEIGVLANGTIHVINGMAYEYDWESSSSICTAFDFAELDAGIPGMEIVYGSDYDKVTILNGIDHTEIKSFELGTVTITHIQAADLDNNGIMELCISLEDAVIITNLDGDVLCTCPVGEEYAPDVGRVLCGDFNDDNVNELLVGLGSKFVEFRVGESVPDPTPACDETGVTLEMPRELYSPGDVFSLDATICNHSDQLLYRSNIFVLLDVYGTYWCAPSWISTTEGIDAYSYSIPRGAWQFQVLPGFVWPNVEGHASNLYFMGAIVNSEMTDVIGEIGRVRFEW